ncbi:TonB-dependent receptor [Hyphococcus flavus]|uniref:TonB-dependent receptor n=1 Tax=Hyphococcus flavus TaxID=1866326 RepID=A0AAF0CEK1_9PROT|nr:TonB-dependent receptor [Hyphococcus flavus]WDI31406.1 TonB-dependent receptor [Hyphococcus flavus]
MRKELLFGLSIGCVLVAQAHGQTQPVDEIIVVADPLELIELEESRAVMGLDLSYAEAPRSVNVISDATIERFSIETVDDLAAFAPGTFTGSFFGVPGAVSLRGNRADTYFRGFKRVENPGTFPTPLGASERIEIVKGPTPAIYGAGRVGGLLNITPLTARTAKEVRDEGHLLSLSGTLGSYNKRIIRGDGGIAFDLGGYDAGLYAHAEYENSDSFYRGIEPERTLVQSAFTLAGDNIEMELGGAFFSSNGYKQTPGWNRVTQDLIDNGVYITGRDTDLADLNGDGKLTPDEVDAAVGSFFGTSNIRQFVDFGVFPAPAFELDTGVGTGTLSARTVFISNNDIADAETLTAYADLGWSAGNGELRIQGFFDSMESALYQSYGFAAEYISDVYELRGSYAFGWNIGPVVIDSIFGASWRSYDNTTRQTFLSGYLVLDRRDLTVGPAGNDIFDDPFSVEPNGIDWDTDLDSRWTDLAFFTANDVALTDRFHLLASLRLDRFSASSINTGATIFDPGLGFTQFEADEFTPSYEFSLRYDALDWLSFYGTYAENNALETNDGGGIEVDRIAQGNFVADSDLFEAGLKIKRRDLVGSLAFYDQNRTRQDPFGNLDEEQSKGVEGELRYLLSDAFSLNGAVTWQQTEVSAPGQCGSGNGEFVVIPPVRAGVSPFDGYGGLFAALNASCLAELQDGYVRNTAPEWLASGFLTYTGPYTDVGSFGASAGVVYVGETGGKIDGAVTLPDYILAKAAFFYEFRNLSLIVNIDNLFDKRHFIPVQNVYEEVGALPGRGREFSVTLTAQF